MSALTTPVLSDEQQRRFWATADTTGECWPWTGTLSPHGYGRFVVGRRGYSAHRVAYELAAGPIPEGMVIDHLCRNRRCVNPAHMEPVTNRENVLRGETLPAANVDKETCPKGHPYDGRKVRGDRYCLTCNREEYRRYMDRNREAINERKRQARLAPQPARLREALEDMVSLATDGAARQHLDRSGIMQDPPHGMGKFAECEAPWCVRNQKRIAAALAALATGDEP